MLDWLIVGGGIHGVHIAHSLLRRCGVARDRLCVIDPHADPLARWNHCTENVGMRYLRSPSVHHLGLDSEELTRFGRTPHGRVLERYSPPYDRPAYDFFQAHARQVVTESKLVDCWQQDSASGLRRVPGGWGVQCAQGEIQARRVVLALGRTALRIPDWAAVLQAQGRRWITSLRPASVAPTCPIGNMPWCWAAASLPGRRRWHWPNANPAR
ncbi:MAG: FAD/NAD(P)-binding protein [Caldilineaceae bacterium]